MKAITIIQPWASLIAVGAKRYETRSWPTRYRGTIAIHAGKKLFDTDCYLDRELWPFAEALRLPDIYSFEKLPRGAIIATARLLECWHCIGPDRKGDPMLYNGRVGIAADNRYIEDKELFFGDFLSGRYAWELINVTPLPEPIPARGAQGLWNWEETS